MTINLSGAVNATASIVPDLLVNLVPPGITSINGLPTNRVGAVGTASWGPLNQAVPLGTMSDYSLAFGPVMPRKYDLGTGLALSVLNGAVNMLGVRVSDGTDTAATLTILGATLTSKYTGSGANADTAQLLKGSAANSFRLVLSRPGRPPEVFDNITGAGAAFWTNLVAAVNVGNGALRGPSALFLASTAGATTAAATTAIITAAGGTDGATTITASTLQGVDGAPRTGMYALRGSGANIAFLQEADDGLTDGAQFAYGLSEGTYMMGVGPAGESVAAAVTAKATSGTDTFAYKRLIGDYVVFNDTANSQQRTVSPQGVAAGRLANLGPHQSGLNKLISGIVGTQRSVANTPYSSGDLQNLGQAGIDVIMNPVPGGNYFGMRFGRNGSSNAAIHGDNYTRMSFYIATTINGALGPYIGRVQGTRYTKTRENAKASLDAFFQALVDANMVDSFQTQLNATNNPPPRVAAGYLQADVKVVYLGIVETFLVNIEGGQTVQIQSQGVTLSAAA